MLVQRLDRLRRQLHRYGLPDVLGPDHLRVHRPSCECASLIQSANSCIAQDSQAESLGPQSSYANFGAWFAAVGQAYCQTGVTPVCQ